MNILKIDFECTFFSETNDKQFIAYQTLKEEIFLHNIQTNDKFNITKAVVPIKYYDIDFKGNIYINGTNPSYTSCKGIYKYKKHCIINIVDENHFSCLIIEPNINNKILNVICRKYKLSNIESIDCEDKKISFIINVCSKECNNHHNLCKQNEKNISSARTNLWRAPNPYEFILTTDNYETNHKSIILNIEDLDFIELQNYYLLISNSYIKTIHNNLCNYSLNQHKTGSCFVFFSPIDKKVQVYYCFDKSIYVCESENANLVDVSNNIILQSIKNGKPETILFDKFKMNMTKNCKENNEKIITKLEFKENNEDKFNEEKENFKLLIKKFEEDKKKLRKQKKIIKYLVKNL